jgi:hypothetical protein
MLAMASRRRERGCTAPTCFCPHVEVLDATESGVYFSIRAGRLGVTSRCAASGVSPHAVGTRPTRSHTSPKSIRPVANTRNETPTITHAARATTSRPGRCRGCNAWTRSRSSRSKRERSPMGRRQGSTQQRERSGDPGPRCFEAAPQSGCNIPVGKLQLDTQPHRLPQARAQAGQGGIDGRLHRRDVDEALDRVEVVLDQARGVEAVPTPDPVAHDAMAHPVAIEVGGDPEHPGLMGAVGLVIASTCGPRSGERLGCEVGGNGDRPRALAQEPTTSEKLTWKKSSKASCSTREPSPGTVDSSIDPVVSPLAGASTGPSSRRFRGTAERVTGPSGIGRSGSRRCGRSG